ncbi:hypothetical protein QBC43DRAFT_292784 [Cladorrhinum sp. PSN259]|nr:hypothetical protein QBC43DRAFT_292784 [Cladorrhinum sp. PSN259]
MKYLLAFSVSLLAVEQALAASVHCTVTGSSLVKRMCEFDNCPSTGHAHVGQVLHAGCLADCSTEADPWVKLLDDTYVRATEATLTACHSFSKPSSIKDLPRCHVQSRSPKPSNCATLSASRLSNLSKEKLNPSPLRPRYFADDVPSNSTIIPGNNSTLSGNSTLPGNSTLSGNSTSLPQRKPTWINKRVNVLPRWYKQRAVRSLNHPAIDAANVTAPATNETVIANGTTLTAGTKNFGKQPATLEVRAVTPPAPWNATFPNATATEAGNATSSAAPQGHRKPRSPRKIPVSLWA